MMKNKKSPFLQTVYTAGLMGDCLPVSPGAHAKECGGGGVFGVHGP